MEAFHSFPDAPADLREFLGAEDQRGDASDDDELGDAEAEEATTPEAPGRTPPAPGNDGEPTPDHGVATVGEEDGAGGGKRGAGKGGGPGREPRRH